LIKSDDKNGVSGDAGMTFQQPISGDGVGLLKLQETWENAHMKSFNIALLTGAALSVTAVGAQADDLNVLKAQIEALNARVAAMEVAPSVPAGYQLLSISEGEQRRIPGLDLTSRERATYSKTVNTISILPTADAPAGATITWTGFVRAGLVYGDSESSLDFYSRTNDAAAWVDTGSEDRSSDDLDVLATANLVVTATTDTAVGEIGVMIQIEAEYDGVESEENYDQIEINKAWGYWSMTPELTFGGGYAGSLGNIGYGMDGACTCHYYSAVAFNPGDTSQMRLTYASGPFSAAIALEDASLQDGVLATLSEDQLGVAGEIKYTGDMFSGEVSGVWRGLNDSENLVSDADEDVIGDDWWQVGAGLAFGLGEAASVSLAAAMGEGPTTIVSNDGPSDSLADNPWRNNWWGVSGIISGNLTDEVHAEVGAGYLSRDYNDVLYEGSRLSGSSERWVVGGGLYYTPVDQLTIGVEASYSDTQLDALDDDVDVLDPDFRVEGDSNDTTVALLSVWRF
jgi:hypothetical protein